MKTSRRRYLMAAAAFMPTALVAVGCSNTSATIPASLANAQAEANALLQAFTELASFVPGTPAISSALAIAKDAVSIFTAIPAGGSYLAAAKDVIAALSPLIALIPMGAPTLLAVNAGIGLITALLNGVSAVPAPAASSSLGATPNVIAAPIAIPVIS
jgi:hypothetical protein